MRNQSTEINHQLVKVLFRYESSVLDQVVVETLWASKIDEENGIYKLDNIPFFGPLIAPGDEFLASFDKDEGMFTYKHRTKLSGNSVVLITIMNEGVDKELIRNEFNSLHCSSEGFKDRYFAMEIPESVNYAKVKSLLDSYFNEGILDYAEPCLSAKHRKESTGDDGTFFTRLIRRFRRNSKRI